MKFDRFIQALLPKNSNFYHQFDHAAANVLESSRVFRRLLDVPVDERPAYFRQLEELEHAGDDVTHAIYSELSTTFVTPFDREDIHAIASNLDDIVDYIEAASICVQLYNIKSFPEAAFELAEILVQTVEELARAVPLLSDMRHEIRIREACVRINSFENQADKVFHRGIAHLFTSATDPVEIIKVKELLADLETATDKCESVAHLMENILLKNA